MAIVVKDWKDEEDPIGDYPGGTPIDGNSLEDLEARVGEYADDQVAAEAARAEAAEVLNARFSLSVAAVASAAAALAINRLTPVDATAKALVMTLPAGKPEATVLAVEKQDASEHAVTVEGNLRGVAGEKIELTLLKETIFLVADAEGHWWPISSHKTLSSLKALFDPAGAAAAVGVAAAEDVDAEEARAKAAEATKAELAVLDVRQFLSAGVVDFAAAVKAMEEERKALLIPLSVTPKEEAVLCNKVNVSAPKSTFKYVFIFEGNPTITLPTMANGHFLFRFNETAEGVNVDTSLYFHPDVVLLGDFFVHGSGVNDGGSFASSYRRPFAIHGTPTFESLNNGIVERQSNDRSFVHGMHGNQTVTGWLLQLEEGDGKDIRQIQAYGGRGVSAKHGSGTIGEVVSGIHKFAAASYTLEKWHLEGDGPDGEKPSEPLIVFEGGVYRVQGARLYTLTEPKRPVIEIKDSGASERWTELLLDSVRFMQRADDPSNPGGLAQPIGNLQGVAGKLVALSPQTVIKLRNVRAEFFQQTAESSQFDTRSKIGFKLEAPGQAQLEELLTARRVAISSEDGDIRYNKDSELWEWAPLAPVVTKRFPQPALTLTKFAKASAGAKSAPTTRAAAKRYYRVWAIDDQGRQTQLSAEQNTTPAEGEVPVVAIKAGFPCRVILETGTEAGVFTEWVEIILPTGYAVLADQGNAIGGQTWSAVGLPAAPTIAESQNNTANGRVTGGVAESFAAAVFTTGEWQKAGDILTLPSGQRYVCTVNAAANNGGTWVAAPTGMSAYRLIRSADGRGTVAAEAGKKYFVDPAAADQSSPGPGTVQSLIRFVAAEHAVPGLTTKLMVSGIVFDSTALGKKITLGLYPVNNGAALSLGNVVAGSTVELEPEANKALAINSADITPPADGIYALGYTVSGAPSGGFGVSAELKVHNV